MTTNNTDVKAHYLALAREVVELLHETISTYDGIFTFAIGGESGSGKSTLSMAIRSVLKEEEYKTFIFHQDDYFHLPPRDNHEQRVRDITSVGPQEVNLELLQEHVKEIKKGTGLLKKPLVSYRENQIYEVIAETEDTDVIIVEGTYALLLKEADCRIFMSRDYVETFEHRVSRGRDPIAPFYENILEIEHNIIKEHYNLADILIDKDYDIRVQNQKLKESGCV